MADDDEPDKRLTTSSTIVPIEIEGSTLFLTVVNLFVNIFCYVTLIFLLIL